MGTAFQFLTVFLKKCGSKQEDVDYRPLFENFLQVQFTYLFLSTSASPQLVFVYVCQSSACFCLRLPVLSFFFYVCQSSACFYLRLPVISCFCLRPPVLSLSLSTSASPQLVFVYVCQSSACFCLRLPVLSLFLSTSASPQRVVYVRQSSACCLRLPVLSLFLSPSASPQLLCAGN
jgi:hypothetical protein